MNRTFTEREIAALPTIADVIGNYMEAISRFEDNGGWQSNSMMGRFPSDAFWNSPYADFCNNADDDQFVAVRTQKGRVTLKPNLRNRPFLFRGEKKDHGQIISSFSQENFDKDKQLIERRKAREKHLIANLQAEDFMALLKTHPIFMMLDRGIFLPPEKKPIFINMNYYGLAQHYNFRTGLIDFTPEIEVAAFFATTINKGNDVYEPLTDIKKYPYGVIFVHEINPLITFKGLGFTTIGLQLYPRTGMQKGFCFNEGVTPFDINEIVKPVYFRQDADLSKQLYERMKGGKALFAEDHLAKYAQSIIDSKEVTGQTFAQNLYSNQDDMQENLDTLQRYGIKVNWHKVQYFDVDMLHELEQDLKNGLWEQFCNKIYFADYKKGEAMKDSLLYLPQNPAYRHYFDIDYYDIITAYDADLHRRAGRNSKRC